MFFAYAIIYTTPVVIGVLAAMGLVCWVVGKYRAQYLWDAEDAWCDAIDELNCKVMQRSNKLRKFNKRLNSQNSNFTNLIEEYNHLMAAVLSCGPEREVYKICCYYDCS